MTLVIVALPRISYSQDIEGVAGELKKIKEAKPLKISGGLNAGTGFYANAGMPSRRAPFTWAVNANVNFNFYDKINVPLSINYTDNGSTYSAENPVKKYIDDILNRTGISPKYRSVTLHLGDRSMNFSKYTYAGLRFYGAGIEWAPKNAIIKFSGFYGSFNRRTNLDTINGVYIAPSFERMGWGTKIEVGKENHKFGAIIFKAKDDTYDGDILITRYGIKPEENLVFGFDTKHKIGKKIDFNFEYTTSAYSSDSRSNPYETVGNYNYFNNLGKLFAPGMATIYNSAYNGSLQYKHQYFTVGYTYLWIDPTYKSLGAIAAKNDIQAHTINCNITLFKGKVILGGNGGLERNNLGNNMAVAMNRKIYAGNITWNAFTGFSVTGTYSNFNHSTSPTTINKADSIKLVQINHNMTGAVNYNWGKGDLKHVAMVNYSQQNVQDIKEIYNQQIMTPNDVANIMGNYNVTSSILNLTGGVSLMKNTVTAPTATITSFGPSLNVSKRLFDKKLNLMFSATYLDNAETTSKSETTNYKFGAQYKKGKHHSLKMETAFINKNIKLGDGKSFKEFIGKISYDFSF